MISRYCFDEPTDWAFDITYMLFGAMFMLGAAYALPKGAHIRTDIFWEGFSDRTQGPDRLRRLRRCFSFRASPCCS